MMGKGGRFANVQNRRRALMRTRDELLRRGVRGLAAFAKEEQLSRADAALRFVQLAHFHRAAEAFLGHPIRASQLMRAVLRTVDFDDELVSYLVRLGPVGSGARWAARAYTALLLTRERRARGQFFTPEPVARVMAGWAIASKTDRVLDPGSGPGQLLAAAASRLRALGCAEPATQLVGVELSPLAPTFATLALAPETAMVRVDRADFLTTFRARRGSFDAAIANPPYSRHHALPTAYKERIGNLADAITGRRVHRSAGIYVHFLLLALTLLRDGGRLAFLTPREFFDARYGATIKAHLLQHARLRALIVLDPKAASAFDGVMTTSAITFLERGRPDSAPVRVVQVRQLPSTRVLLEALRPKARVGKRRWGWIDDVTAKDLASATRWSAALRGRRLRRTGARTHVPLRELVDAKRGIATGANRFFVLSQDAVEAHGLKNGSLRPAIARARLATGRRIVPRDFEKWRAGGERVWLLDIRHTPPTEAERAYLEVGKKLGYDKRTLARDRSPWYRMEQREPPSVLVTYMSKDGPRFVRNDAKLVPLNVFHGLYPKRLTPAQVDRLIAHLNGEAFRHQFRHAARTYGGGLLKIEPRELLALRVPDVRLNSVMARRKASASSRSAATEPVP